MEDSSQSTFVMERYVSARYDSHYFDPPMGGRVGALSRMFQWWRGIYLNGSPPDSESDCFAAPCIKRLEDDI